MPRPLSVLALDVGEKRVGLAITSLVARLPRPLVTLERNESFFDALTEVIKAENVSALVLGWPRGLRGQRTAQTNYIEVFADQLRKHLDLPVHFQDEAVTSLRA